MRNNVVTPSMLATAKYFGVLLAMFLVQILLGAIAAHYQVECQVQYGYELANILPYSLSPHLAYRCWEDSINS